MPGKGEWILCTYAEKAGTKYPNTTRHLAKSLTESLKIAMNMFPYDEFRICVRNIGKNIRSTDFMILRLEDGQGIGEIEFWPKGYNPIPLEKIL